MTTTTNSVIYRNEKHNRQVEVFTPASEDKEYTGVEVCDLNGNWKAEIGCWFDGNKLIDYDGVYVLNRWVIKALRKAGYCVPRDFEA